MPKTRAELVNEAVELLQEDGAGQSVAAEDFAIFDKAVEPLVAELWQARVAYIGNVDQIDDALFDPLARLLMNQVGEKFGRPSSAEFRAVEELRLRRAVTNGPLYTVLRTDYF